MKKEIIISLALLATLSLSSCSKDYLDTVPTSQVGAGTAVATVDNAMKSLNGVARSMTTQHAGFGQGFAGENNIMAHYENYPSENYLYNAYAAGWADIHNQMMHNNTQTKYDEYAWYYYYQLITNSNTIIKNIDGAAGDENKKKFIKASALTFRAYSFEKLIRYYCYRWQDSNNGSSQGLVLRLDDSTGDLAFSTLAETYAQVYKDLDEAIKLFSETTYQRAPNEVWIPNANVAHAVYARAALSKQDYAKAKSEASLAKKDFPLMSNADYKNGFANPTSEWIFGSYGGSQEQNWYWSYGVMFSCNGYYAAKTANGAGAIGRELINRIPDNDVRKSLFITEDKFPNYDFSGDEAQKSVIDNTFGRTQIPSDETMANPIYKGIYTDITKYIKDNTPSSIPGDFPAYKAGVYYLGGQLKFWVFDHPGVSYLPFIRTSEMILIEAEASFKLGDEQAAKAALVELNKTSGRNPQYAATKTGKDLWNEIMDYREVELWGEGFAWSDYKRWARPIVRKTVENGGNAHPSIAITINPEEVNKWTWAVPKLETDYNHGNKKDK